MEKYYEQYEAQEVAKNKPLLIGDGFYKALAEDEEKFSSFFQAFVFKAFGLNQGAKLTAFYKAAWEETFNIIKEVIWYHLLIKYSKLSKEVRENLKADDYDGIGKYFAEGFLTYGNFKDQNWLAANVSEMLNSISSHLQDRLSEHAIIWKALWEQSSADVDACFKMKESFFTMHEYIGKKLILPDSIWYRLYFSQWLLDETNYFEALHNLLAKEQDGFNLFTILTRVKHNLYPAIVDFEKKITARGYGKETHPFYTVRAGWNPNTNEYGYGINKTIAGKSVPRLPSFCLWKLYRTLPEETHLGSDWQTLFLSDIERFSLKNNEAEIVSEESIKSPKKASKKTKEHIEYSEDTLQRVIDTCNDASKREILEFYKQKISEVWSTTKRWAEVMLQGNSVVAVIRTSENKDQASVHIDLYEREVKVPFCSAIYAEDVYSKDRDIMFASYSGEGKEIGAIRQLIEHRVAQEPKIVALFSETQKELFIDMCVRAFTDILYDEKDRGQNARIQKIMNTIDLEVEDGWVTADKYPRLELPTLSKTASSISTDQLVSDMQEYITETRRYPSFVMDSLTQWLNQGEYKDTSITALSPNQIDHIALRYNKDYRSNTYKNLSSDQLMTEYNFLDKKGFNANYLLAHIVYNRLLSYDKNAPTFLKDFIYDNSKYIHFAAYHHAFKDKMIPYLKELIDTLPPAVAKKKDDKTPPRKSEWKWKWVLEEIIAQPFPWKEVEPNTMVYERSLDEYTTLLKQDLIVVAHLKDLQENPENGVKSLENMLETNAEALSRYLKKLQDDGQLVPYFDIIHTHASAELYANLVKLWYESQGKDQLSAIITSLARDKSAEQEPQFATWAESDYTFKPKAKAVKPRFSFEKNATYKLINDIVLALPEKDAILEQIPELKKQLNDLRNTYSKYMHYHIVKPMNDNVLMK